MNIAAILSLKKLPTYTHWLAFSKEHSESNDCAFCDSPIVRKPYRVCRKCYARYDVHMDVDGDQRMISKDSVKAKVYGYLSEEDRATLALILQAKGIDL